MAKFTLWILISSILYIKLASKIERKIFPFQPVIVVLLDKAGEIKAFNLPPRYLLFKIFQLYK